MFGSEFTRPFDHPQDTPISVSIRLPLVDPRIQNTFQRLDLICEVFFFSLLVLFVFADASIVDDQERMVGESEQDLEGQRALSPKRT
jgi:hypothetical protein